MLAGPPWNDAERAGPCPWPPSQGVGASAGPGPLAWGSPHNSLPVPENHLYTTDCRPTRGPLTCFRGPDLAPPARDYPLGTWPHQPVSELPSWNCWAGLLGAVHAPGLGHELGLRAGAAPLCWPLIHAGPFFLLCQGVHAGGSHVGSPSLPWGGLGWSPGLLRAKRDKAALWPGR